MLLAGETYGCLREVLIIASGLSIQDPRERPAEQREKADALHRRFWAPTAALSLSKGQASPFDKLRARLEGLRDPTRG